MIGDTFLNKDCRAGTLTVYCKTQPDVLKLLLQLSVPFHKRARTIKQILLMILLSTLIAACSGVSAVKTIETPILASTEESADPSIPLKLEILNEFNDGQSLTVRGRVVPKISFPLSETAVRLQAIDGQGVTRKAEWFAGQELTGVGPIVAKGTILPFSLTLPVNDISDYQIELLWGTEAKQLSAKLPEQEPAFVALRNLSVQRVRDPRCAADPCLVSLQVVGEIFNSGQQVVSGIDLAAGIISQPEGSDIELLNDIPDTERRIEVRNLNLQPGASRPLRIGFDEQFDSEVARFLKPAIRIVSVKTKLE